MSCVAELEKHDWAEKIQAASPQLVVVKLTANEKKRAMIIAEQIAQDPNSRDPIATNDSRLAAKRELITRRYLFKKFTPWQNRMEAIHET